MEWFLRGNALATAARTGGMNAEKGFEFQKSYAAWLLTRLLIGAERLSAVRYEGAQDVDLMLNNGHQIHVQIKKFDKTPLTFSAMADIIKSFLQDYRDVGSTNGVAACDRLTFRLVAVATVTDIAVLDIARQNNRHIHAPKLANAISAPNKALAKTKMEVRAVLDRLDGQLFPVSSPAGMYRTLAEAGLFRFGVTLDRLDDAVRALIDGIRWRDEIRARDVANWISPYLSPKHPASGKGAIKLITERVKPNRSPEAFYSGQAAIWPAIFADMDTPRDELAAVIASIDHPAVSKILITGPSGAGKSTLARRAVWEAAQRGNALVLEASDQTEAAECWDEALRLAQQQGASENKVLLVIDDLSDFDQLISRAADLPADSPLKIVGTTWRAGSTMQRLGEGVAEISINHISEREALAISAKLGRPLDQMSPQQIDRIRDSGQFLLLNLILLGEGSAERFAARLLERLKDEAPDLIEAYLDLCVFGRYDLSIPISLLVRRNRNAARMRESGEVAGLVFAIGTSRLRSGHRLLSSAVIAAAHVEPIGRMIAIATEADPALEYERRFVVRAITIATSDEHIEIGRASSKTIAWLARETAAVGNYYDIRRLARSLERLGLQSQAAEIGALATEDRILTGADAAAYQGEHEDEDSEQTFNVMLSFYERDPTFWGWRNFLRFASTRGDDRQKIAALDQASARLARSDLGPSDGKAIIDLVAVIGEPPDYAPRLLIRVLEKFPKQMAVARAVANCIISRVRSPEAFLALFNYCLPLLKSIGSEEIILIRNVTRASMHAHNPDRLRWLDQMIRLAKGEQEGEARGILLHCSAEIADTRRLKEVLDLIGPEMIGERDEHQRARHIVHRKQKADSVIAS